MIRTVRTLLVVGAAIALALIIPSSERVMAAKDDGLFEDKVVATAKTFEIKRSEVDEAFVAFLANAEAIKERVPEGKREVLEAELLNEIILTRILLSKATDEDKAAAEKSAREMTEKVKARSSSETMFKMKLRALGLTLEEFSKQVADQELRKEVLRREVGGKITISDEEVKKFYDENPKEFERPEFFRAAHVLISTVDKDTKRPMAGDKRREKEALAKKVKDLAEAGEEFGKLANEFSEDPGSKNNGGEYTFARGGMVKPFEDAVLKLSTNQISGLVETQFGFHIIKLLERNAARKESIEQATPRVKEFLLGKAVAAKLPSFYEQLRKENDVKIVDERLNAAFAEGQAKILEKMAQP